MKKNVVLFLLILTFISCNKQSKGLNLSTKDDKSYLIDSEDTIKLGNNNLSKNLFQGLNSELYPTIQNDETNPPNRLDVYDEIEGIYINSKIFNCFNFENGEITKNDNEFDILFIYPEMSRYNFQFSETLGYRIFHYLGYLYEEPSNGQNLAYFVKKITQKDNNSLFMTYTDNSNTMDKRNKVDTLIMSTYPTIKFEFLNNNLSDFQKSTQYIKLSDDILNEIYITIPKNSIPQDINELYLKEIITKLLNKKFNTNLNTNQILEKTEQK